MPEAKEFEEFIYCSLCNRGEYKGMPCPACGGVGKILVHGRPWVHCRLCIRGEYKGKPCPACKGVGKVF